MTLGASLFLVAVGSISLWVSLASRRAAPEPPPPPSSSYS
jgi:hypothetical protein